MHSVAQVSRVRDCLCRDVLDQSVPTATTDSLNVDRTDFLSGPRLSLDSPIDSSASKVKAMRRVGWPPLGDETASIHRDPVDAAVDQFLKEARHRRVG
jgi:hypothetical protein